MKIFNWDELLVLLAIVGIICATIAGIICYESGYNSGYEQGFADAENQTNTTQEYYVEEYHDDNMVFENFITWVSDENGNALFDFDMTVPFENTEFADDITITIHVNKGDKIDQSKNITSSWNIEYYGE